ncbi:hypothetical protein DRN76_05305 [Methanosarcinales archaeon]|nr:MAG: hypothetical protein DRN76_05305 [Methanosarcinales archaeon]
MGDVFIKICYESPGNEYCALLKTGPNFFEFHDLGMLFRYRLQASFQTQQYGTGVIVKIH